MKQATQPMDECRNDLDIFTDLAARVGINDDNDKNEEQRLRELTANAIDDVKAFRDAGVARFVCPRMPWQRRATLTKINRSMCGRLFAPKGICCSVAVGVRA